MKYFFPLKFGAALSLLAAGCATLAYTNSDHFDGKKFFNPDGATPKGFIDLLKWQLGGGKTPWPEHVENKAKPKVATHVLPGQVHLTFINHATMLLQFENLNVITDPVYAERVSPVQWAGPKRVREPGLAFDKLPPIDVVVVSHNHYDHMDLVALKKLNDRFHPQFIVPLANQGLLKGAGVENIVELDWWQSNTVKSGKITLVPAQHWSSRSPFDRDRALWGGFVIEAGGIRSYFAGDSGYGPHFKMLKERMKEIDVALLPIGAYEPRWFMKYHHMNPDDAVLAHLDLQPKLSIAMHFGCFRLTNEGIDDPVKDLKTALEAHKVPLREFVAPETGETIVYHKAKE
jgi:L-ascorbate metabolism protein UlaG (beta-lactamase superfamily)